VNGSSAQPGVTAADLANLPASVVAHGVDLTPVDRIARLLEAHGERFTRRVFTPSEIAFCAAAPRRPAERYAARFAAKEAALKALGTGLSHGIRWTDIAVERLPSGAPELHLAGRAAEIAAERRISRLLVSLSHAGGLAFASVIAVRD